MQRAALLFATLLAALLAGLVHPARAAAFACGRLPGPAPAHLQHVIVVMFENESYGDVIGAAGSAASLRAPNLNRLASRCGNATNMWAATHPSHPNYMAVTGGQPYPNDEHVRGPSIFQQVEAAGGSWRSYVEGMPKPCATGSAFPYKAGHNPALWYRGLEESCAEADVRLRAFRRDLADDALPIYSFVVPSQCHNMHASCRAGADPVGEADAWIDEWVARIVNTPSYRRGETVVYLTWDEGSSGQSGEEVGMNCVASGRSRRPNESCHIPTVVISPYVPRHTSVNAFFSLYSLLKATERQLGLPLLGHARDAGTSGMRRFFGT